MQTLILSITILMTIRSFTLKGTPGNKDHPKRGILRTSKRYNEGLME
ncbi:MAG: hypothetical protein ACMUEL_02350 [Flavobacteriales bacterium Tduv]